MAISLPFRCVFLLLLCTICFAEDRDIYLVLVEGDQPVAFFQDSSVSYKSNKKLDTNSEILKAHAKHLEESHDQLLQSTLEKGAYNKLYSFNHIVNGFSVHTTPSQAKKLKNTPGVKLIEKDNGVKLMTTYTPKFLELPTGVWPTVGGRRHAGEGIVIGFVDSGINPSHPSFAYRPRRGYPKNLTEFNGVCDEGPMFPKSSCNGKIVTARYFSAGVKASGLLNASVDILSPYDAVGHGSHVAATAAGNYGVPVVVNGFYYGRASGMAPRARIAVYKAIYPSVGTKTDVLAAMEQAIKDRVDILSLSIGPDTPPKKTLTMLSMFDIFMLFARVASCDTDRTYPGSLILGNGQRISGIGLSGPTFGNTLLRYKLVLAKDATLANGNFSRTPEYVEECQHPEAFDPVIVQRSVVICTFSSGFLKGSSNPTAISNTARTLRFMGFVLIANPMYGDFLTEPLPFSIPGIMIPKTSDSKVILDYYEKQTERDSNGVVTAFRGRAAIGEGRFDPGVIMDPNEREHRSYSVEFKLHVCKDIFLYVMMLIIVSVFRSKLWIDVRYKYGSPTRCRSSCIDQAAEPFIVIATMKRLRWQPQHCTYDNRGEPYYGPQPIYLHLEPFNPFDQAAGSDNPTRAC
ncbi:subtilisin-like protease SBT2.4 [Tanacetum coccineum]